LSDILVGYLYSNSQLRAESRKGMKELASAILMCALAFISKLFSITITDLNIYFAQGHAYPWGRN
jgi:hypothetical protein